VQEVLQQSISIKSSLHLENIAVVLDQALFAKGTEIAWRYPEMFGSIVLMMGNFHTICNLMSTVGKTFGDAGLRGLVVVLGVIAEGSIQIDSSTILYLGTVKDLPALFLQLLSTLHVLKIIVFFPK